MGGTGLGLAIVKHLVKAHGWDMQVETTVGKGARVVFLSRRFYEIRSGKSELRPEGNENVYFTYYCATAAN